MEKKYNKLLDWDKVGNLPYFPMGIAKAIMAELESIKNIRIEEDELALYVKVGKGNKNLVVVETHLDHPGYVVNTRGEVVSVGSLYRSKMLKDIDVDRTQPVNFYNKFGEVIGEGEIESVKVIGTMLKATVKGRKKWPVNTQVLPRVKTGVFGDLLHLRSVDNLATTFVCLELIKYFADKNAEVNLTFIFSKLEEVYQIAACGVAKSNGTPFENFDGNTSFLVLEVGPVCKGEIEEGAKMAIAKTENGIVFESGKENVVKTVLKKVSKKHGIVLEEVGLSSHGDSIAFRLIGGWKKVVCLLMHSKNRHNISSTGEFVAEQVNKKSIEKMIEVVKGSVLELCSLKLTKDVRIDSWGTVAEAVKREQLVANYKWAKARLKAKKLFPETTVDWVKFVLASIWAKI